MKDFNWQKVVLFLAAAALGFLFKTLRVPIPYMLGGIVVTFVSKTFIDLKSPTSNFHINILKLAVSDAKISLKVA